MPKEELPPLVESALKLVIETRGLESDEGYLRMLASSIYAAGRFDGILEALKVGQESTSL